MNNLALDTMRELARTHERAAKALWGRADRALSPRVRATLMIRANEEQQRALYWTLRARNLAPKGARASA